MMIKYIFIYQLDHTKLLFNFKTYFIVRITYLIISYFVINLWFILYVNSFTYSIVYTIYIVSWLFNLGTS